MTPLSKNARAAGILYILASAVGFVRLIYIPSALIVSGNAAATAGNIAAHELLFRWSIVSELLGAALWLFVPLALYRLFKEVDRGLATLMVILGGLMQVPLFFMNAVSDVAALLFARSENFLAVFDKPQRDAIVMLFLRLHHHGDLANEIFWGIWLLPFGLLVYKSRFLPRLLGIWLMIACFGYLALSLSGLLLPQWESTVFRLVQPVTLGELVVMLWLVIAGAREPRLAASDQLGPA
jgi:hypothetical protein